MKFTTATWKPILFCSRAVWQYSCKILHLHKASLLIFKFTVGKAFINALSKSLVSCRGPFSLPDKFKGVPRSVLLKDLFYFARKVKICHFLNEKVTVCHFLIQKRNDLSLFVTRRPY